MESVDNKDEKSYPENYPVPGIHSKALRAGKRTYFFDVKSTRNNEYYLTITESKKKFTENGNFRYEKHKLFLYPEDFEKFAETLEEIIDYIHKNQPEIANRNEEETEETSYEQNSEKGLSDLSFEDI